MIAINQTSKSIKKKGAGYKKSLRNKYAQTQLENYGKMFLSNFDKMDDIMHNDVNY